ncbi:hypothetical protein [Azospirillum sp. ST 5-10]|uniref:hypothetical protein n=1 Tax=unclassified Azospirillum TaxID=2630922 RepID=UPI003F4A30D9
MPPLLRVAALLPALLPGVAAADGVEPVRPDRHHLAPPAQPPREPPPALPPRTRFVRAQVVYRLPMALSEVADADPALSRLCRRGAFVQEANGFYWARTPQRSYGVAFSGGANLIDPQNRRRPGKVYFFQDPDARCTVWVADQARVMSHYVGP